MIDLSEFYAVPPFSWGHDEKEQRLCSALRMLRAHHLENCPEFRKLDHLLGGGAEPGAVEAFPFLPVRLFKMYALRSVGKESVLKTMTSSGTSGQAASQIYLDRETATSQTKALAHIVKNFMGNARLPMVIVDSRSVIKDPKMYSARGAGILGFANFGRDHFYALNDSMELDVDGLQAFLEKHAGSRILFFGFTFMIWKHLCEPLGLRSIGLGLEDAIVFHGGGWKKMKEQSVSNEVFKSRLREICGAGTRVHSFYGMAEQTGSIHMECEFGCLHASNFGQIVVRDPVSFKPLAFGHPGLIETVSVLPWSYPGHVLLTEDIGEVLGEDDCPCGRKGRYFAVHGRLPKAEERGCSDTYASAR